MPASAAQLQGVGIGLRARHYREFKQQQVAVDWHEVHTENYLQAGGVDRHVLFELRQRYPISLHGVGMGIGSAQGFSPAHLRRVAQLVRALEPALVSEHLCWGAVADRHLNDLLPLPLSRPALELVCQRVHQVQDAIQQTILLENVSTYLRFRADAMSEAEFLSEVAQRTGCGILLDVNNLYVNQCNHQESALAAIDRVSAEHVGEIHLAGHLVTPDAVVDHHGDRVAASVWRLYEHALQRFGPVPTLIEWDTDIPALEVLLAEADTARALMLKTCPAATPPHAADSTLRTSARGRVEAVAAPALEAIQHGFAQALLGQHAPDAFVGEPSRSAARFARYRGHLVSTWEKTLAAAYPVLQQLVGEEFFAALARAYGSAHPSSSGDLNDFGADFAQFLAGFSPVADYPYFPDMARLEWALHRAYYAADGDPISAQDLVDLTPEMLGQTCLRLQPGCVLLASRWAIAGLWQAHQREAPSEFAEPLDQRCHVLVCRPAWKPQVLSLSAAGHRWLTGLAEGAAFGSALDAALGLDAEFDVVGLLQQCLASQVLQRPAAVIGVPPGR